MIAACSHAAPVPGVGPPPPPGLETAQASKHASANLNTEAVIERIVLSMDADRPCISSLDSSWPYSAPFNSEQYSAINLFEVAEVAARAASDMLILARRLSALTSVDEREAVARQHTWSSFNVPLL